MAYVRNMRETNIDDPPSRIQGRDPFVETRPTMWRNPSYTLPLPSTPYPYSSFPRRSPPPIPESGYVVESCTTRIRSSPQYVSETRVPLDVIETARPYSPKQMVEQPQRVPGTFFGSGRRSESLLPLDRIHQDGHLDVTRFTTEGLIGFHDYLKKSAVAGRSLASVLHDTGDGELRKTTCAAMGDVMKKLNDITSFKSQDALYCLLGICEISNCRNQEDVNTLTDLGFADLFMKIWKNLNKENINDQINHPDSYIAANLLLDATQRLTELSVELCNQMGKECLPALLEFAKDDFFSVAALNMDDDELKWMSRRELLKKLFTIFYHCIRNYPDNRKVFRNHQASDFLRYFLDCRFFILRAKTLFILAYVVTEEENEELYTTSLNIQFIVKILRKALEEPSHYSAHYNYFAHEVVEAIQHVAANDENKVRFVEEDVLPCLVKMMAAEHFQERKSAINALWVLSFSTANKSKILQENDCVDAVKLCLEVAELAKPCRAILWNLGVLTPEELPKEKKDEDETEDIDEAGTSGDSEAGPTKVKRSTDKPMHVMLSYQWDVQKEILKVKDLLKANDFNVWIDVEQMGGSTLEAMASAVEGASVVIICFSEKYKDSPACRTEAEYSYKLRKPIIPLKMQKGYDPNGWLGAMLGTAFYVEMFTVDHVKHNMGGLLFQLANRERFRSQDDVGTSVVTPPTSPVVERHTQRARRRSIQPPPPSPPPRPTMFMSIDTKLVQHWSSHDVTSWLAANSFSHLRNWFVAFKGEELIELRSISLHAPEFFYKKLETEFGFRTLLEMIQFKKLLENIY